MEIYKRIAVLMSMGIMAIGLISFSTASGAVSENTSKGADTTVVSDTGNTDRSNPGTSASIVSSTPTPIPTPTPVPNDLLINSDPKINELVKAYLAAKLSCTREAFEGIVTDTGYINVDRLMIQTETVLSYDLLNCYTKRGYSPIDYVVYYTYNMNITTLGSPVLAIDSLYVQVDENGEYKVFLGKLDDDVEAGLEALAQDADVQAVLSDVQESISKAMDEDETLLQYWQRLYENLGISFESNDREADE